jgi:hypothetical protein
MSEVNARKMKNQQPVSLSQKCSSTPVGFGFLSKEKSDKNWDMPHSLLTYVPPTLQLKHPFFSLQHIRVFRIMNTYYLSNYH